MELYAQPLDPIPDLTSRIAHASFSKGMLAIHLRDALGPIYEDADFAQLFPKRGRAAEAHFQTSDGHRLASPGKPLGPPRSFDGSGTLGLEICAFLATG
jgi:hypothetical protein